VEQGPFAVDFPATRIDLDDKTLTVTLKDVITGQSLGSLQVGYDKRIAELKAVHMKDRGWVMFNMTKIARQLAPSFHPSYKLLLSVISKQQQKQAIKFARLASRQQEPEAFPPPTTSSESSRKRTHDLSPSTDEGSAKRAQQEQESSPSPALSEPKTPNQPISPVNADFTGSTWEKKDETNMAHLLRTFLDNTIDVLQDPFCKIEWQMSNSKLMELTAT